MHPATKAEFKAEFSIEVMGVVKLLHWWQKLSATFYSVLDRKGMH